MATIKLKRGQESKVPSLPKEDGSLIFGYNTASTPATIQLDQNISGTVQRLDLSVANSSTSNYSKNSAALGGSSLSQVLAQGGNGNSFTGLDTTTNNIVKLTRANGGTVQKTIDNVSHATSATISSTSTIASTANISKNSNALDSSSLSQILNYVNNNYTKVTQLTNQDLNTIKTSGFYFAGGSNTCTNKPSGIDAFGLEVIRTASGYYTQRLISSNVNPNTIYTRYFNSSSWSAWTNTFNIKASTASTADISKNSNALSGSSLQNILDKINSTSGSGNAFTSLDTATNNTIKLTRANGGTTQKIIDNVSHASTSSYSSNSGQLQGHVITTTAVGSSATFANKIPYIQSDGVLELSRYIDFHGDSVSRDFNLRFDTATSSNLIITGPSASTVTASYFNGNAKNSNALGGSSLSQILDSISSKTNASTYLNNCFISRPTDANIGITGKGGIKTFKATSSMTTHKPMSDGHILHFDWDNTGGYDSQLFLQNGSSPHIQIRGMSTGNWGSWINILDQNNYTSYAAKKNAYNSASISNATIKLGRSDSSTGTTLTVNNVSHATSATISSNSNALGGSSLSQVLSSAGSGKYLPLAGGTMTGIINNGRFQISRGEGSHGTSGWVKIIHIKISSTYKNIPLKFEITQRQRKLPTQLYIAFNSVDSVDPSLHYFTFTGQDISSQVIIVKDATSEWSVWVQKVESYDDICITEYSTNFDYMSGVSVTYPFTLSSSKPANGTSPSPGGMVELSKNSNALGGSSLSQILNSITSGSIQADVATRLASSSKSIANNFTIRTGVPTSSWTQYPIFPIYNTTDSTLTAYKGKSLSILHMDGGAQRHDIVALNGANDGLIYATATSAGTTSSRIERILDGGNYGSLITNLSKQVTFANGLKVQKNVQMDGGNFSTGSTVTTGNGETSISNVKISVSGNTLVITTK